MSIYQKPQVGEITLKGLSGNAYAFKVYPWGTSFNSIGAVYTALKRNASNYTILYIGQTEDLSKRFDDHHKQLCFDRNGKTHIGVHVEASEARRFAKETDLIRNYSTTCND